MPNQPTPERIQQSIENLKAHRGPYSDFTGCQNKCSRNCVAVAGLIRPDWLPQLEDAAVEAGFSSVSKLLSYLLMKNIMSLEGDFCQPINTAELEQINKPYIRCPQRHQDSLRNLEVHGDKYTDFDGCALECERHCVPVTAIVHPEWLPRLEGIHDCFGFDTVGGILIFLVEKYVLGIDPFKTGHMCQPIIKSKSS